MPLQALTIVGLAGALGPAQAAKYAVEYANEVRKKPNNFNEFDS